MKDYEDVKPWYILKTMVPNTIEIHADLLLGTKIIFYLEKLPNKIKVSHRVIMATGKELQTYKLKFDTPEEFLTLKAYMQWYTCLKRTYKFATTRHGIEYAFEEGGVIKYYPYKSKEAKEKLRNVHYYQPKATRMDD